jgi:hypothetical protein
MAWEDEVDDEERENTMARRWARKVERACCAFAKYLPLVFVYGLTTWAVWVVVKIGQDSKKSYWVGKCISRHHHRQLQLQLQLPRTSC